MSCWEAVEEFCRGWLGTVPYVDETGALRCDGLPSFSVDLGTASWGELSFKPCKELSEVWQQSFRGTYDTPYRRREAAVQRRRYCSSQSGEDPKETLAQGRRGELAAHRGVPRELLAPAWGQRLGGGPRAGKV